MTPFITYITRAHVSLHAFSFTEMIQIYVMIIFFIAFCFISPVMFYQLWAFIAPGLHNNERQFIYKYSFFSVLLFCAGVAFAFYVGFPIIIQFALKLSLTLNISPVIGFKAYLVELIRWLFTFGILFQLPILFIGLAKFGLIDITSLKHYRKYIYFACFVLASIIAPPDLTLNILLTFHSYCSLSSVRSSLNLHTEANRQHINLIRINAVIIVILQYRIFPTSQQKKQALGLFFIF